MEIKKSFRFHFRGAHIARTKIVRATCDSGSAHSGALANSTLNFRGGKWERRKTLTFIGNRQIITQNILQIALHSYPKTQLFFPKTKTSSTPLSHKNTFLFQFQFLFLGSISRSVVVVGEVRSAGVVVVFLCFSVLICSHLYFLFAARG